MAVLALVDRREERSALDDLLAAVRAGMSGTLVLEGEPGIGKTALLEYAIGSATDFRVARAPGERRVERRSEPGDTRVRP
jgi:MoxR-like ATPase